MGQGRWRSCDGTRRCDRSSTDSGASPGLLSRGIYSASRFDLINPVHCVGPVIRCEWKSNVYRGNDQQKRARRNPFVISLGAVWSCLNLLRANRSGERSRQLVARVTLISFGVAVLQQAHSSTSIACFMLGTVLILVTNLSFFKRRPQRVYALTLTLMLLGGIGMLLGGEATVAGAFGKDPGLSDRTTIWAAVIPACPNPLLGAGFESFWNGYGKYVTGGLSKYERGSELSAQRLHRGLGQPRMGWSGPDRDAFDQRLSAGLRGVSAEPRGWQPDAGLCCDCFDVQYH